MSGGKVARMKPDWWGGLQPWQSERKSDFHTSGRC